MAANHAGHLSTRNRCVVQRLEEIHLHLLRIRGETLVTVITQRQQGGGGEVAHNAVHIRGERLAGQHRQGDKPRIQARVAAQYPAQRRHQHRRRGKATLLGARSEGRPLRRAERGGVARVVRNLLPIQRDGGAAQHLRAGFRRQCKGRGQTIQAVRPPLPVPLAATLPSRGLHRQLLRLEVVAER